MVQVGDLEDKAVIMLGKDLGLRVGDFVQLKRKPLIEAYKDQNEFPIEVEIETQKRGVLAIGHIMEETWNILQRYWNNNPESEYVFSSNVNGREHVSPDRANDVLKNTWIKAFPDREDTSVRFHELRSFKMSMLTNSGVNQWAIKRMTGKKVSKDILTYLTSLNLKEQFKKVEQAFRLTGFTQNNHQKIDELAEKVDELSVEIEKWKRIAIDMKSQVDNLLKIDVKEVANEFWEIVQSDTKKGFIITLVQTPDGQVIEIGVKPKKT